VPHADHPFGFINAKKPPGITSTAFGTRVRHLLGRVPLGHWGTLDPDASGVLVLAVGHATRLLPLLGEGRKSYEFDLVLGRATDTGDASGVVTASGAAPADWPRALPVIAAALVGWLAQTPPMFSAVKVDGQPLYKRARRGEELVRAARIVEIFRLGVLECGIDRARLEVECSAGTYVRTLCEEIGLRLGVPAHMAALVRTAAGPFTLEQACADDALFADPRSHVIDPLRVLTQSRVALGPDEVSRFAHGNIVNVPGGLEEGEILVTLDGRLVGTGRVIAEEFSAQLQPTRVFL
jgi:tRNA pseudouridine55 synthase